MDIEILEDTKTKLTFKIKGEDHTILNLLKEELWLDKAVKTAAYKLDHPLIGVPQMTVEVTSGNEPRKVINDAVKRLEKKLDKLKEEFKDACK
jgi:DNA-directed RNA polymerase subunit L